jgi:hypothetical protein
LVSLLSVLVISYTVSIYQSTTGASSKEYYAYLYTWFVGLSNTQTIALTPCPLMFTLFPLSSYYYYDYS